MGAEGRPHALYSALILARVRSLGEMSGDFLGFLLSACADANAVHILPHAIIFITDFECGLS